MRRRARDAPAPVSLTVSHCRKGQQHPWGAKAHLCSARCPRLRKRRACRPALMPARLACPSCMRRSTALFSSRPRALPPPPRASRAGGGANTMPLAIAQRRKAGLWVMLQAGNTQAGACLSSPQKEGQRSQLNTRFRVLQAQSCVILLQTATTCCAPDAGGHPQGCHKHPRHHHPRHSAQEALRDLACSKGSSRAARACFALAGSCIAIMLVRQLLAASNSCNAYHDGTSQ